MRDGGIQGGQHEVADTQQAEARDSCGGIVGTEHELEYLNDVVVALKVVQGWVTADGFDDYVGELFFEAFEVLI